MTVHITNQMSSSALKCSVHFWVLLTAGGSPWWGCATAGDCSPEDTIDADHCGHNVHFQSLTGCAKVRMSCKFEIGVEVKVWVKNGQNQRGQRNRGYKWIFHHRRESNSWRSDKVKWEREGCLHRVSQPLNGSHQPNPEGPRASGGRNLWATNQLQAELRHAHPTV